MPLQSTLRSAPTNSSTPSRCQQGSHVAFDICQTFLEETVGPVDLREKVRSVQCAARCARGRVDGAHQRVGTHPCLFLSFLQRLVDSTCVSSPGLGTEQSLNHDGDFAARQFLPLLSPRCVDNVSLAMLRISSRSRAFLKLWRKSPFQDCTSVLRTGGRP